MEKSSPKRRERRKSHMKTLPTVPESVGGSPQVSKRGQGSARMRTPGSASHRRPKDSGRSSNPSTPSTPHSAKADEESNGDGDEVPTYLAFVMTNRVIPQPPPAALSRADEERKTEAVKRVQKVQRGRTARMRMRGGAWGKAGDETVAPVLNADPDESLSPVTESWTAAKFLSNFNLPELLAARLIEPGCKNELGSLRSLAKSADLAKVLRERLNAAVDVLVEKLEPALRELASGAAATPKQLQAKFLQEGAGLLSYGDLNTFFGGLEAMVGAPLPRVREAMATEHTQQPDSRLEFTTKNYVVTTTSETEWKFVAEPSSRSPDAWPLEAKLVLAAKHPGGRVTSLRDVVQIVANERHKNRREPMPEGVLRFKVAATSLKLQQQGEPALTIEEAFAARLYTGPLFTKYNTVLRGLDGPVLWLRCELVRLCCSSEDAVAHNAAAEAAKAKRLKEEPTFDERNPTAEDEVAALLSAS